VQYNLVFGGQEAQYIVAVLPKDGKGAEGFINFLTSFIVQ
jgi:hypothetical protein